MPARVSIAIKKRSPGRPPGSTREVTRANILLGARTCFARLGFDLATNRDIAEQAGVTAPAIYSYFPSKGALYAATARAAMAEVARHIEKLADKHADLGANLSQITRGLLALHRSDPSLGAFLSAMPTELQRHPELTRELKSEPNAIRGVLEAIIKNAVRLKQIDPRAAPYTVAMFIACLMGLSQFSVLFGIEIGAPAATTFAELLEQSHPSRAKSQRRRPARKRSR